MNATRSYRVYLPPAYAGSQKRYPVIYWFHGYEPSNQQRDVEIGEGGLMLEKARRIKPLELGHDLAEGRRQRRGEGAEPEKDGLFGHRRLNAFFR